MQSLISLGLIGMYSITRLYPSAPNLPSFIRKAPGIPPRPNVQSFAVGWKSARDAASAKCGVSGAPQYHTNPRSRFQLESRKREAKDIQHFTKVLKPSKVKRYANTVLIVGFYETDLRLSSLRTVSIPLTANANYRGKSFFPERHQLMQ